MRRIGIGLLVAIVVYGLAGFVGVPMLLYHVVATQGSAALHRQASLGHAYFNPFRLRLELDKLHVAGRSGNDQFVYLGHLHLKVSWVSLFRLAPIVSEVKLTDPDIHIVRNADKTFNFSDLLGAPGQPPPPPAPPSKPLRFAVSNIQLAGGRIQFDDNLLNSKHVIDKIRLDVPFIANLPADVDIFVQPLLEMVVDGNSPLKITGKAKPFANPPESEIDLNLHRLDLPGYAAYLPPSVPIKLPKGALTVGLQVHFVNGPEKPLIRTSGAAAIDELDVRDAANAPLLSVNHFAVDLADVEPLNQVVHLDKIYVDGLAATLVRNADGTTNLTPLTSGKPAAGAGAPPPPGNQSAPQAASAAAPATQASATPAPIATASPIAASPAATSPTALPTQVPTTPAPAPSSSAVAPASTAASPASPIAVPTSVLASPSAQATSTAAQSMSLMTTTNAPAPGAPSAAPASQNTKLDLTLNTFEMVNSSVKLTDNTVAPPIGVALEAIHIDFSKFQLGGKTPSPFDFSAKIGGGNDRGQRRA